MDTAVLDTCLAAIEMFLILGIGVRAAESPAHHVPKVKEYCQWEKFNVKCADNEVIVMEMARYGRMQTGRCAAKNYGHVGCAISVLPHMDTLCSGRTWCNVTVPDEKMRSTGACPTEIASYLDASYSCVPVETGDGTSCYSLGRLNLEKSEGFISNAVAETMDRGTAQCPWVITAGPGQKINVTLHDFSAVRQFSQHSTGKHGGKHQNEVVDETRHRTYCHKYAVIKESQATRETVVCGGDDRERVVYISATNQVEIQLAKLGNSKKETYFLLEYSAIGCPLLSAPPGGWIDRVSDERVILGCNTTRETWYLHCDGNKWAGPHRNCSMPPEAAESIWSAISDDWSSPFGILIVSALGVALGLVIGISLLSVVLVVVKKKKNSCLIGDPPGYEETAQDSDENTGHYVIQNKRNSATLLMGDNMEMQTMVDPATYGAIWRSRPPSYSTEPGDEHPGRFTGPVTPRTGALRAEGRMAGTLPRASELSRTRHHDSHVYESPQFMRREGGSQDTLDRDKV